MEEIGSRATILELEGLGSEKRKYLKWLLVLETRRLFGRSSAFRMTCPRTAAPEETQLLSVLKIPVLCGPHVGTSVHRRERCRLQERVGDACNDRPVLLRGGSHCEPLRISNKRVPFRLAFGETLPRKQIS
jgi:hypothetical protein